MRDQLRSLLERAAIAGENEAGRRAWAVVRAAFAEREPQPRARRFPLRPAIALAAVAVVVGIAVSPAGGWIRDSIGRERVVGVPVAEPGLGSLPAPGRLLVSSRRGIWVVSADGSKRFLGAYDGGSWSPRGLFVVAWRGRQIVALDPARTGDVRWALSRDRVADARWAPSGYRVAYRSGASLRVVAGDGTGDRLLAASVAPVAPAWRPGAAHVLAYADREGRVRLVDVDTRAELSRTQAGLAVRELVWTEDGERLLVLTPEEVRVYRTDHPWHGPWTGERPGIAGAVVDVAPQPGSGEVALAFFHVRTERALVLCPASPCRFEGRGLLRDLTWSPDGRWLLLSWPEADQLLFIRAGDGKLVAVSNVAREFDPGEIGPAQFPRIEGWVPDRPS